MKIASSIADLLFEHECVVIPGLGGFITKTHPASVHPVKHQFKPPHKEIVFNQHLRANDGMLLNHIAHKESLPYSEAKKRMDKFVLRCLEEMQVGRRINFRQIGSLSMDDTQQLIFDPDLSQNYLAESFGLSGFVSPAIKRETFTKKLEQQIKQQREEKSRKLNNDHPKKAVIAPKKQVFRASKRKNSYKKQLVFIGVLLVFMFSGWLYMNKQLVQQYYQNYASLIPFFYSSPNEYVATNMDRFGMMSVLENKSSVKVNEAGLTAENLLLKKNTKVAAKTDELTQLTAEAENTSEADIIETPVIEKTEEATAEISAETFSASPEEIPVDLVEPIAPAQVETRTQAKYFIIAGAFREKTNAVNLVATLRSKGFDAVFAGQTGSGLHRVAFEGHQSKSEALSRLDAIKEEENENAWLFSM
jgi:cell division protein FtsN